MAVHPWTGIRVRDLSNTRRQYLPLRTDSVYQGKYELDAWATLTLEQQVSGSETHVL
jgi:hypothetical protein